MYHIFNFISRCNIKRIFCSLFSERKWHFAEITECHIKKKKNELLGFDSLQYRDIKETYILVTACAFSFIESLFCYGGVVVSLLCIIGTFSAGHQWTFSYCSTRHSYLFSNVISIVVKCFIMFITHNIDNVTNWKTIIEFSSITSIHTVAAN